MPGAVSASSTKTSVLQSSAPSFAAKQSVRNERSLFSAASSVATANGAFSLVACDVGQDCTSVHRDLQQACAYGGYCNAENFEELYQNFLASPWAYTQAQRYRALIHTAIRDRNWSLIGITPKLLNRDNTSQ